MTLLRVYKAAKIRGVPGAHRDDESEGEMERGSAEREKRVGGGGKVGFGCISSRESIFRSGIRSTVASDGNGSDTRPELVPAPVPSFTSLRSSLPHPILTDPLCTSHLYFPSMSSRAKLSVILSQHDGSYRLVVSF